MEKPRVADRGRIHSFQPPGFGRPQVAGVSKLEGLIFLRIFGRIFFLKVKMNSSHIVELVIVILFFFVGCWSWVLLFWKIL